MLYGLNHKGLDLEASTAQGEYFDIDYSIIVIFLTLVFLKH